MLVDAYAKYYENPTLQSAELLWEVISSYDFVDYQTCINEIVALRRKTVIHFDSDLSLMSNGSYGVRRNFQFGPNGSFWLYTVERANKFFKSAIFDLSFVLFPSSCIFTACELQDQPIFAKYSLRTRVDQPKLVQRLLGYLQYLPDKITLSAVPSTFLFLFSQRDFENFLPHEQVESILPLNWEPFFKKKSLLSKGVHINDCCINWTTMLNFNTCRYNTRHFLPTFAVENTIVNLLNLCGSADYPQDDLMVIDKQRALCPCGRWYLPFIFIPHIDYALRSDDGRVIYDDTIPDKLESTFYNLQFIRSLEGVDILYCSPSLSKHDEEWLRAYFENYGLVTNFISDRLWLCGAGKYLPFWGKLTNYQSWQHRRPPLML